MAEFVTKLVTSHTADHSMGRRLNKVERPLVFIDDDGEEYIVREGFVTDFASVPRILAMVFAGLLIISIIFDPSAMAARIALVLVGAFFALFPASGFHAEAATLHDHCYRETDMPRSKADFLFLKAMECCGVWAIKRYPMFFAVFLFGWMARRRRG